MSRKSKSKAEQEQQHEHAQIRPTGHTVGISHLVLNAVSVFLLAGGEGGGGGGGVHSNLKGR